MKKILWTGCLICALLVILIGCKAENNVTINPAYSPVQDSRSMTYDAATDKTTLTNGEANIQLPGQWEEQDGCYINATYGFVNFIQYNGIVTVYDYTNEYTSSAGWPIGDQDSQLTITTLDDRTVYGFHVNSDKATYQFIYTTDPNTESSSATALIATALQSFKLQSSSAESE